MKYFLLALCIVIVLPLSAQELTRADTIEIQEKAVRHLRQFEGLLNLISQPDEYFRKYNFEGWPAATTKKAPTIKSFATRRS